MKKYFLLFIVWIMILTSCTTYEIEIPGDIGKSFEERDNKDIDNNQDQNKDNRDEEKENKEDKENSNIEKTETSEKILEMENTMIDLVNQERKKEGLNELELDKELRDLARIKSSDIADNNYFDHISPTYGSPFEMMEQFGIDFILAAENLAGHQSVKQAHEGLMDSKGHRANILRSGLTHIGIGIVKDDKYEYIFTQMFITKN